MPAAYYTPKSTREANVLDAELAAGELDEEVEVASTPAQKLAADLAELAEFAVDHEDAGYDPAPFVAMAQGRMDQEAGLLESGKLALWCGALHDERERRARRAR